MVRQRHSKYSAHDTGGRDSAGGDRKESLRESRLSFSSRAEDVTLSAVEVQKRNPERVNVYIEGSFAFSLSALLAHQYKLRRGACIPAETMREVLKQDDVGKAIDAAARLLAFRPRSERELTRRLAQKGYTSEIAEEAVGRLRDQGLVKDAEFARFWVENREQFKPMGSRRLRSELAQKGVDREAIDEALGEQSSEQQYELALRAATSKLRSYSGLEYEVFHRRMGGYLARQGFDYETSSRVMKRLWSETHDDSEDAGESAFNE